MRLVFQSRTRHAVCARCFQDSSQNGHAGNFGWHRGKQRVESYSRVGEAMFLANSWSPGSWHSRRAGGWSGQRGCHCSGDSSHTFGPSEASSTPRAMSLTQMGGSSCGSRHNVHSQNIDGSRKATSSSKYLFEPRGGRGATMRHSNWIRLSSSLARLDPAPRLFRCGHLCFSGEMIPNVVTSTHELPRCMHACFAFSKSCLIPHFAINFSQVGNIVDLWFLVCPFWVLFFLSGFSNFGPHFSGCSFCQFPPGQHISF